MKRYIIFILLLSQPSILIAQLSLRGLDSLLNKGNYIDFDKEFSSLNPDSVYNHLKNNYILFYKDNRKGDCLLAMSDLYRKLSESNTHDVIRLQIINDFLDYLLDTSFNTGYMPYFTKKDIVQVVNYRQRLIEGIRKQGMLHLSTSNHMFIKDFKLKELIPDLWIYYRKLEKKDFEREWAGMEIKQADILSLLAVLEDKNAILLYKKYLWKCIEDGKEGKVVRNDFYLRLIKSGHKCKALMDEYFSLLNYFLKNTDISIYEGEICTLHCFETFGQIGENYIFKHIIYYVDGLPKKYVLAREKQSYDNLYTKQNIEELILWYKVNRNYKLN